MTIRCPACKGEMKQVSARANPGTLILLDQCGECGGIWCDKWELFPIAPEEAPRVELLDESLLRSPVALAAEPLYCPRCTERLPSFAESHGCKPVDECEVGTLRSLGEGGYASEGSALRSVWRGTTAVRPWGSIVLSRPAAAAGNPTPALSQVRRHLAQPRAVQPL